MTFLETFLLGACITATLTLTWFRSRFPIHLLSLVLACAGSHLFSNAPSREELAGWTRKNFSDWSAMYLPSFLAELVNCPHCLSFHFGLYTAIVFCLLAGAPWFWLLAGPFAWAGLATLSLSLHEH